MKHVSIQQKGLEKIKALKRKKPEYLIKVTLVFLYKPSAWPTVLIFSNYAWYSIARKSLDSFTLVNLNNCEPAWSLTTTFNLLIEIDFTGAAIA